MANSVTARPMFDLAFDPSGVLYGIDARSTLFRIDPNTAATLTTAQTVAMCDELFEAHRDLLPAAFFAEKA